MGLLNRIEELEKELAELKCKVKEGPKFPEYGDGYWYIDDYGYILNEKWDGLDFEEFRLKIGNMFKTKEQAEFAVEKLKVEAELRNLSDSWDLEKTQYTFSFNWEVGEFEIEYPDYNQYPDSYYFDSVDSLEQALETVGEGRIKKYIFEV